MSNGGHSRSSSGKNRPILNSPKLQKCKILRYATRSLPFHCRTRLRAPLRSPSPTRRPPQNPCTTIRLCFPASFHPRNTSWTERDPRFLARDCTVGAADWLRLCSLLHESQCAETECGALELAEEHWRCRRRQGAVVVLGASEAFEPREPDDWRYRQNLSWLRLDADNCNKSTL